MKPEPAPLPMRRRLLGWCLALVAALTLRPGWSRQAPKPYLREADFYRRRG